MSTFITVAIPYVNSTPHLGYAFELIEADLVARARRSLGESVRFLGGTDDYSLKNLLAAQTAGLPTQAFVDRHADQFQALQPLLDISFDDFIRTSSDPRHRPAVERLWNVREQRGNLYQRTYQGS
jgi:methionyl-tRNA synthetase